jgi:CRISPR-associated endonuclease Csn1
MALWKQTQQFPQKTLAAWFALNPYELRSKALKEQLSLEELGRVFYHLIQRRGFLSNSRKGGSTDGTLFKGNPKEGKTGILQTETAIANATLGAYLYTIYPKSNTPYKKGGTRIRNRYTTRKMYTEEFEAIWEAQTKYHKTLTNELKTKLGGRKLDGYAEDGILFYQRPLKSQKHLVGLCTFEKTLKDGAGKYIRKGKPKCPVSAVMYEEFVIWQWVNTIEFNGTKLVKDDRLKIVDFLYKTEKTTFKKISLI